MRPISYYKIGYQGETKLLTQLIEVHPQPSNNGHPVDGALVSAGSWCVWILDTHSS